MGSFMTLPVEARAAVAAAIAFGKHRPPVFVSRKDLETTEMPEYWLDMEYDVAGDGWWCTVAPVPKSERGVKVHYGDPGDEHEHVHRGLD